MQQRDHFLRQAQAAPAAQARPPARAAEASDAQLADALARAEELLAATAEPVATLHAACEAAGASPPGAPAPPSTGPLGPQAAQLVAHLAAALPGDPALLQRAQLAVVRHRDARSAVLEAETALRQGRADRATLERLRLALYHVSALPREFAGNPLLARLFPGPRTHGPAAPLSAVQRLKRKLAAEAALEAARELADQLAPPMRLAAMALAMLDGERRPGLDDLLDPRVRRARLLAVTLRSDELAASRLRAGLGQHEALRKALAATRSPADAAAVEAASLPLASFEAECRAHPRLASLF